MAGMLQAELQRCALMSQGLREAEQQRFNSA
jgi:hypothetical protein